MRIVSELAIWQGKCLWLTIGISANIFWGKGHDKYRLAFHESSAFVDRRCGIPVVHGEVSGRCGFV
jgi:hypothetical protein